MKRHPFEKTEFPSLTFSRAVGVVVLSLVVAPIAASLIAESMLRSINKRKLCPEDIQGLALYYAPSSYTVHRLPRGRSQAGLRVRINQRGYRGGEFEEIKPDGVKRILVYGGDSVFEAEAPEESQWTSRLARKLENKWPTIQLINAGVPGFRSFDSLSWFLTEGHRFKPDLVLYQFSIDDMYYLKKGESVYKDTKLHKSKKNPFRHPVNWIDAAVCRNSVLYSSIRTNYFLRKHRLTPEERATRLEQKIAETRSKKLEDIQALQLRQFRLSIESFALATRQAGSTPVFLTRPFFLADSAAESQGQKNMLAFLDMSKAEALAANDTLTSIMKSVAEVLNVPLIDLRESIADPAHFASAPGNLTDLAREEVSRITEKKVVPLLSQGEADNAH